MSQRCLKHSVSKTQTTMFSQNQYFLITDVLVNGHNTQYFELKGKTKQKTCSTVRVSALKIWLYRASLRKDKIYISAWTNELTKVTDLCMSSLTSCVHTKGTQCLWRCLLLLTPSFIPVTTSSLFILSVRFLLWLFLLLPYSSVIP